jgi:hypothetical protein
MRAPCTHLKQREDEHIGRNHTEAFKAKGASMAIREEKMPAEMSACVLKLWSIDSISIE